MRGRKNKMIIQCNGCGVVKNMDVLETYPYQDDDYGFSRPIDPIFTLDCSPHKSFQDSSPHENNWKRVYVCHECFHKLEPDMWISQTCWESINPVVKFEDLDDLCGVASRWFDFYEKLKGKQNE